MTFLDGFEGWLVAFGEAGRKQDMETPGIMASQCPYCA